MLQFCDIFIKKAQNILGLYCTILIAEFGHLKVFRYNAYICESFFYEFGLFDHSDDFDNI